MTEPLVTTGLTAADAEVLRLVKDFYQVAPFLCLIIAGIIIAFIAIKYFSKGSKKFINLIDQRIEEKLITRVCTLERESAESKAREQVMTIQFTELKSEISHIKKTADMLLDFTMKSKKSK